ncbi:glutathione S-transferase family protein [Pseudodonghicola flavimaris]|uniref:Glutathione S-transferase family protein n=1 Tax=Pseudodonghicola flavimaris TaxID=3050036 RepID=A0ABT7F7C1_9RHOB|nr:glutathione S-transferase family protein [Pseudodonghicola flavimaris]MDK3020493.1 glutathione S-transferase family protein [Pseudodonghicola flavimaris]
MPILYHSPLTRSTRVITQLMMMDRLDAVEVRLVSVPRRDGSGHRDPANPHPEGKVPLLIGDDGAAIRESNAVMLYLDEYFGHPLGIAPGRPGRGTFLSWMCYYGGVVEPALALAIAGVSHPALTSTFRGMPEVEAQIAAGLGQAPFLMGARFTVADLIMASAFQWAASTFTLQSPVVRDWVARVTERVGGVPVNDYEQKAQARLAAAG